MKGKIRNDEIAKILFEIGEYLEMQNVPFKPRAYQKVAAAIEGLEEDLSDMYRRGGIKAIEEIPGVGKGIAEKIEELIKTGRLKYHETLKKKTPVDLSGLTAIEGLGAKKIKILYAELGVKNVKELERAAKAGRIKGLKGFGEKSEQNILRGIEFLKKSGGRFILAWMMPLIAEIERRLRSRKEVKKVIIAGSARRFKETIGDVDVLAVVDGKPPASAPSSVKTLAGRKAAAGKIMDYFVSMPEVTAVHAHGKTKSSVKLENNLDVDLRIVPEESYGAALNYFTGSKSHNVALRVIAMKKGYKLNEYGLFEAIAEQRGTTPQYQSSKTRYGARRGTTRKKERRIAGRSEEEIYKALGVDYIPPEMRENTGEIELAMKKKLPKLIGYGDLKGDLQIQTNWSDGANSIEEMAEAAIKAGLEYILITDHTRRLAMANGLDEKRLMKQMKEIDRINKKLKVKGCKLRVLKGTECDILKDGSLDLPDGVLSKLDIVGVAVHSSFNLPRGEQTERIKKAMRNPHADILFHPTGRIINRREAYDVDMEEIIETAKETGTVLEIDAYPDRLDLKDEYIRKCVETGVKMSISSDAHSVNHIPYLKYGIAQARRGWATRGDIINAWKLDKMLSFLKKGK